MIECKKEHIEFICQMNDDDRYIDGFALKILSRKYDIRFEIFLEDYLNPTRTQISEAFVLRILEEKVKNGKYGAWDLARELETLLLQTARYDEYTRAIICNIDKCEIKMFDLKAQREEEQRMKQIYTGQ